MRPRQDPTPELLRLAEKQAYTLSRKQCHAAGLSGDVIDRLLRSQWQVIFPGYYAVHRIPIDWKARAWTGVLIGGPSASVGGWAAAHLHGFAPELGLIQIWVRKTPPVPRDGFFFRRETMARLGTTDDLPRTGVADTVLDICQGQGADRVAGIVADACNRTALTPAGLLARLEQRRGMGWRLVQECLAAYMQGAQSPLELRYLRDVEQAHGLPVAQRQVWTAESTRVDALIPEHGLVIELDGRLGHEGTGAFRDRTRDNRHQVNGLLTLRYGWADVAGSPCEVAHEIAMVLFARGWPGPLMRCPNCQNAPVQIGG